MGEVEVSIFEARTEVARVTPAPRWRATFTRRTAAGSLVIALHVLAAIAMLRDKVMQPRIEYLASYEPIVARLIETSWAGSAAPELAVFESAALAPPPIELIEPVLAQIKIEESPTPTSEMQNGQFIPPRTEDASANKLVQFASQASLRPGQMVRVILRVEVLPNGSTGTVAIDTASGFPTADAAAVEYARSLQWVPASFGGVPTAMKVRLPVVFTGAS